MARGIISIRPLFPIKINMPKKTSKIDKTQNVSSLKCLYFLKFNKKKSSTGAKRKTTNNPVDTQCTILFGFHESVGCPKVKAIRHALITAIKHKKSKSLFL